VASEENFDLSPGAVKKLLRLLNEPELLGVSTLAGLPEVDRLVTQLNLRETTANRGLVLGMILQDLISESAASSTEVTPWTVLARTHLDRQPDKAMSREFAVSERTVRRLREEGYRALASSLLRVVLRSRKEALGDAP